MNLAIEVSKMYPQDLESIHHTLLKNFDDFWNYEIFKSELANTNSSYLVAREKKGDHFEIVGFAGIKKILDEANLMNIVVRKDKRHQGIASLLLEHILVLAKHLNCTSITLEVSVANTNAISLYQKYHFETKGTRKKYYHNGEDALIMTRTFSA